MKQLKNDTLFAKDTNNTPEMTEAAAKDDSVDMPIPTPSFLAGSVRTTLSPTRLWTQQPRV